MRSPRWRKSLPRQKAKDRVHRAKGWLIVLLPLLVAPIRSTEPIRRSGKHDLGPSGSQFSYGIDYCLWLQELPHNPKNPYDDLGGEA